VLSFDSQRTTEPTIFPFQPMDLRTLAEPGPGPSVVTDFRIGRDNISPAAKPRPFRVICFGLGGILLQVELKIADLNDRIKIKQIREKTF